MRKLSLSQSHARPVKVDRGLDAKVSAPPSAEQSARDRQQALSRADCPEGVTQSRRRLRHGRAGLISGKRPGCSWASSLSREGSTSGPIRQVGCSHSICWASQFFRGRVTARPPVGVLSAPQQALIRDVGRSSKSGRGKSCEGEAVAVAVVGHHSMNRSLG